MRHCESLSAPRRPRALPLLVAFGSLTILIRPAPAAPPPGAEWKLEWADEFNGKKIDGKKWERVGDGKRRTAFWLKENAYLDGKGRLIVRSKERNGRFSWPKPSRILNDAPNCRRSRTFARMYRRMHREIFMRHCRPTGSATSP